MNQAASTQAKIRVAIAADPLFFQEVGDVAGRFVCSTSMLVVRCLRPALRELEALEPGSRDVASMKRSGRSDPPRGGSSVQSVFMTRDVYERLDREGDRLDLMADEILIWAWKKHAPEMISSFTA